MSDETQAGQEPPVNPPSTQAGQEPPVQSPPETDPQALVKQLTEQRDAARKEAAANRVAANELKKRQDADLTEQQRKDKALQEATQALEQAQSRARGLELQNHLLTKAADYGIRSNAVSLIMRALDQASLYDDDGTLNVDALSKAIKGILRDVPELALDATTLPAGPRDTSAGTNAARPIKSRLTREAIERMSPAEINARYETGEIPDFLRTLQG